MASSNYLCSHRMGGSLSIFRKVVLGKLDKEKCLLPSYLIWIQLMTGLLLLFYDLLLFAISDVVVLLVAAFSSIQSLQVIDFLGGWSVTVHLLCRSSFDNMHG